MILFGSVCVRWVLFRSKLGQCDVFNHPHIRTQSHLQSELEQLLKINNDVDKQNDDLFEENKQLKDSNQKLKEENQKLKSGEENKQLKDSNQKLKEENQKLKSGEENKQLKDSNHKLREESQKLKSELEKLKKALAIFVNDDSSHLGLKTSPPHGTS